MKSLMPNTILHSFTTSQKSEDVANSGDTHNGGTKREQTECTHELPGRSCRIYILNMVNIFIKKSISGLSVGGSNLY